MLWLCVSVRLSQASVPWKLQNLSPCKQRRTEGHSLGSLRVTYTYKKVKVAHTRLSSVGFRSWSRFLAVSLQVTWIVNPTVGCHYFPPGLQLLPQPLRGLLPISLLGEQRHDGCEQFAQDCYPTALRLRCEPKPFCARVQHANHSATEPHIHIHCVSKKQDTKLLPITSPDVNRFSKFFHCQTHW